MPDWRYYLHHLVDIVCDQRRTTYGAFLAILRFLRSGQPAYWWRGEVPVVVPWHGQRTKCVVEWIRYNVDVIEVELTDCGCVAREAPCAS